MIEKKIITVSYMHLKTTKVLPWQPCGFTLVNLRE